MTSQHDNYANLAVAERDLKYFIFDWDNNILHMPTRIHLERCDERGFWVPHSVSTAVFSVIRSDTETFRPPNGDWEEAFSDFRDVSVDNENIFLRDTRLAIDRVMRGESDAAPSFLKFKRTLVEGRLFAIVTARGHDPAVIRQGVEYFIETVLLPEDRRQMLRNLKGYLECFDPGRGAVSDAEALDYYLSLNRYHGVMSEHFQRMVKERSTAERTEGGKQFAIKDFVEHVIRIAREHGLDRPMSVGFSDDDMMNLRAVEDYIRERLAREFPSVKFVVYDTSDPELPAGRKVIVNGQLSLDFSGD